MEKPLLVTDFLDRARRYYDDHEAVLATTGERYTYAELGERADGFAAGLQERGVDKGDRVAVLDPNTHYHLEAAYGSMQVGAVHTPLNYRLTPDDFEYILNDAGVTAIYADYEYAEKVEAVREEVPVETFVTNRPDEVDGDWEDFEAVVDGGTDYDRPEMSEDEIITINYTSGTTGDPKGVCRTHRTETLHAYLVAHHQDVSDDDVYLWTLPMFHVNGWGHIYAVTGAGARHVCTRGVDAEAVFETVAAEDVSYMCAAPTVLNLLMNHYDEAGGDVPTAGENPVRVATAGSAPPEATIRTVEDEFGWYLMHVYGATETGPLITTSDARRFFDDDSPDRFALKKRQGVGYLGTEVRVVDEDGNDVPRDDETIGEIVVRGNQVMDGYWETPEATEEAFNDRVEGYYHMGDLATVDENGFVSIQDRKKDIIVTGGENVSSIELEDV
ncbi:MAG: AMP-binding protein, partial [Haloferacaceae archaeon]